MDKIEKKDIDLFLGEDFKDDKEIKALIDTDKGFNSLDGHLNELWDDAYSEKIDIIEPELMECLRQRKSEYSSDVLAKINSGSGGSKNYHSLTGEKCRAMQDLILEFVGNEGEIPFTVSPTPIPEMPGESKDKANSSLGYRLLDFMKNIGRIPTRSDIKEIQEIVPEEKRSVLKEEADRNAAIVELKIKDKLAESNIIQAFDDFVSDFSTYPNGFIYGPIFRSKKELVRKEKFNQETKKKEYEVKEEEKEYLDFERVSPFDVYPQPGVEDIQDGYVFIRKLTTKHYIESLRSDESYDSKKIESALKEYSDGQSESTDKDPLDNDEKKGLENKSTNVEEEKYKLYMTTFWGRISGSHLKEFGTKKGPDGEELDDVKEYAVWCIRVGKYVIKVEYNPYPLNEIPLHTSSAYNEPGSFWNTGLPKIVRPYQKLANTAIRALQDNTSFSSAPIFDVNISALPKNFELTSIQPRMLIQSVHDTANMNNRAALIAIDTPIKSDQLIYEIDKVMQYADAACGIPRYVHGGQGPASGAGRTASGLSMMMQSSSTKIKQIVSNIDKDIIIPIIKMLYNWMLVEYDDVKALGDVKIVAGGVNSVVSKEQDVTRMIELLRNLSTPLLAPIVGESGFRKLIHKIGKSFGIGSVNGIIPSDSEYTLTKKIQEMKILQQRMTENANQTQGNQAPGETNLQPGGGQKGQQI